MKFWGARPQEKQYFPKKGQPRPAWTYRGARRNLAREMHWPDRYRWRIVWRAIKARIAGLGNRGNVPIPAV